MGDYGDSVPWAVNELSSGLQRARGTVFHYTSSAGLIGSASQGRIWASQASGLNDRAEVRQGWELISSWLGSRRRSYAIDLLQDFAGDPLRGGHEVFVLSGSTHGDDANQWRLYAENGRGYAIELAAASVLSICTRAPEPTRPATKANSSWLFRAGDSVAVTPWYKVLYGDRDAAHALTSLVRSFEFRERQIAKRAKSRDEADFLAGVLKEDAYDALATIAHLVKMQGFAGEHEVRVVATFFAADEHIQYRPGAYGIVGYAELGAAPRGHPTSEVLRPTSRAERRLPIRSVRLGPLLGDEHERTVDAFLRKFGYVDAGVERSMVPLR